MRLTVPTPEGHKIQVADHGTWTEVELLRAGSHRDSICFLEGHSGNSLCLPLDYLSCVQAVLGSGDLHGVAHSKTGLEGSRVAVADSDLGLREAAAASSLWVNKNGGPWALARHENYGSYLYCAPDGVTRDNLDTWIEICGSTKIGQLDFVHCLRYGDYQPKQRYYPGGWDDLLYVVDKLREAGILPLLHTYAPAIDPDAELVHKSDAKPHPQNAYLLVASD